MAELVLDAYSLVPIAKWNVSRPVSGVGVSLDGRRLYLSLPGEVRVVSSSTGRSIRTIDVGGVEGIRSVGLAN